MSPNNDRFRVLRRLPEIKFEDELRGYSKSQVDRVLETLAPLADEVDELLTRLSQAETRAASAEARLVQQSESPASAVDDTPAAPVVEEVVRADGETGSAEPPPDFDETLRKTLLLAQTTADETVRNAHAEAERTIAAAAEEAESLRSAARTETDDIHAENKRTRTALHDEVATERVRLLEDAQEEARTRLASLENELATAHGAERDRLLAEIEELQRTRDYLRNDVELLEGHLAHRRNQLRTALGEMTRALDDPEKLRGSTGPELADPAAIDATDFGPVALPQDAISTLNEEVSADELPPAQPERRDTALSAWSSTPAVDDSSPTELADTTDAVWADDGDTPDLEPTAEETVLDNFADGDPTEMIETVDGPEATWVDEQFDLVESEAEASQPSEAPVAPDTPADDPAHNAADDAADNSADDPAEAPVEKTVDHADDHGSGHASDHAADDSAGDGVAEVTADPLPRRTSASRVEQRNSDVLPEGDRAPVDDAVATSHDIPDVPPLPEGVATQIVDGEIPDPPPPPRPQSPAEMQADHERPAWADDPPPIAADVEPAAGGSQDPFLDELRRVTDEDVDEDDALGRFLREDEGAAGRGGWFGRRK